MRGHPEAAQWVKDVIGALRAVILDAPSVDASISHMVDRPLSASKRPSLACARKPFGPIPSWPAGASL